MTQEHPEDTHRAAKRAKMSSKSSARTPISTFVSVPRHPLGVKPAGNNLLASDASSESTAKRRQAMGKWHRFDDDTILLIISFLQSPKDLLSLSHLSRVLYSFCYHDEVWKNLFLEQKLQFDKWHGSWRRSVLRIPHFEHELLLQSNGLVHSDALYRPYQCSSVDYNQIFHKLIAQEEEKLLGSGVNGSRPSSDDAGHICRVPEQDMTLDNFHSNWIDTPFILTNADSRRWPLQKCSVEYLADNYKSETMRQEVVKWPIELYLQYFHSNRDENPLYLFDPLNQVVRDLQYTVPALFQQDLFDLFEKSRPDHKWIIVGPARSGSTFHKDPNTTSAWNTTMQGKKVWIMTPPDVTPPGVSTDETEEEVTSPIGLLEWVLSGFYNDAVRMSHAGQCLIGVTFPGECLYVPSGWWHAVINVDDSIAITQNFMPLLKLDKVLRFFRLRNEQISGFHPNEVYVEMAHIVDRLQDEAEVELFRGKLELLKAYKDESEDIGELADVKLPIYEIFTALLKLGGYLEALKGSLRRAEELETKAGPVWNDITEQKSSFSFGFEEDE